MIIETLCGHLAPSGEWDVDPAEPMYRAENWEVLRRDTPLVWLRLRSREQIDAIASPYRGQLSGQLAQLAESDYRELPLKVGSKSIRVIGGNRHVTVTRTIRSEPTPVPFEEAVSICDRYGILVEEADDPANAPQLEKTKRKKAKKPTKKSSRPSRKKS